MRGEHKAGRPLSVLIGGCALGVSFAASMAQQTIDPAPSPLPPATADGSPVAAVIVTSESLGPEFERLAHFRSRLGIRTVVRTTRWIDEAFAEFPLPDRAARIRAFLAGAHESWGTRWVLLGGDTDVIPPRYAVSEYFAGERIPSDLYYAALDGDWNADGDDRFGEPPGDSGGDEVDFFPDLRIGRAPVSTPAAARAFVERQIAHELGNGADADSDPASVLFLAEALFDGQDGAEIAERARAFLPSSVRVTRLYENHASYPGSEPETVSSVLAALDRGHGIVSHIGHGFRNTLSVGGGTLGSLEIEGLRKVERRPVFLALTCTSAAIDFNSIGEELVSGGGAIAYLGSSRIAFPGVAQHYLTVFFEAAFQESVRTVGGAVEHVRQRFAPRAVAEGAHRFTQLALTLIGDPLTPLFVRPAPHLVLEHPSLIMPGEREVTLAVRAAGEPVAGARVTLLAHDLGLESGVTGDTGEVTLPVPITTASPIHATATAANTWPALSAIALAGAADPFLCVRRIRIEDADMGDGDHFAEAGEVIELRVMIENAGSRASLAGAARMAVLSGPGTVIEDQAEVPSLLPRESTEIGSLSLRVADTAGDGSLLIVEIETPRSATVRRALEVGAPGIRVAGHRIEGNLDPGETIAYTLELANEGAGTARQVTAWARVIDLAAGTTAATMIDHRARFGDLRPGEWASGDPFVFTLGADPDSVRLDVIVATGLGAETEYRLDLAPPAPPLALVAEGGEGAIRITWRPVGDPDLLGYEVERAPGADGPFARLDSRLLPATYLEDRGLEPLATFAYRVTAIDSSLNRSAASPIAIGTTGPALHPGWPRGVGQATASSPVLADLDGDGASEIVVGADAIHVWKGDASELRDGDGDAGTSGVFTADGVVTGRRGYHSVPAVSDLDGDGELEIIAVAWESAQVFAWKRDGSRLAGWPQSLDGPPNWGSPSIGDLDGDGDFEVCVLGSRHGTVYAWHHDGEELADGDHDPATHGVLLATGAAYSFSTPALGDLDRDGASEIVIGLDEPLGHLHALEADGSEAPGWPVSLGGPISSSAALGDLDGDGRLEVVIAVEDDSVHALTADGRPLDGWPQWAFIENGPARTSSPVLADLDGDGRPEVLQAENSGPTHAARLRAWRADGSELAGFDETVIFATDHEATGARATQSTPVVGDLDGDGDPEILLGAEDGRLYGWNHDGTTISGFPIRTGGEIRGSAALGDVDGDGKVEAVVAGWEKSVYVWDLAGEAGPNALHWPLFRRDTENRGNLTLPRPGRQAPALESARRSRGPELLVQSSPERRGVEIEIALERGGLTRLLLYGVDGRVVRRLVDSPLSGGSHRVTWDGWTDRGTRAAAGVYWLRLEGPGGVAVRRLIKVW